MPGLSVRQASLADCDRLAPLFDRYRQFYDQPADLALARSFLSDRLRAGESYLFAAEDGDDILGFAQLYPSFTSVGASKKLIFNDLYVEEHARGRGVARTLIAEIETFARKQGVSRLSLSTAVDNEPAQRLYRAMGWEVEDDFLTFTRTLDD